MTVRDCRMIFIIGQMFQWKFHHTNFSSFPLNYYLSNFHINLKIAHKCSPIGLFYLFGGLKTIDKRRCLPLALPGLFAKGHLKRESKNKKQIVCVTPKQKKDICLIRESSFQRNMCETANHQSISSLMVVYMACKMICR